MDVADAAGDGADDSLDLFDRHVVLPGQLNNVSISAVMASQSTGIPLGGTVTGAVATSTNEASSASTGLVNGARTSIASPRCLSRSLILTANNECPPSAKK